MREEARPLAQAVEPGDAEGVARINRELASVTGRSF
jgi:hypothetical protein